ncbi:MAG: hypothetical protein IT384_13470 [Deltaproteobacteria bacterium]|nr:hypothetical protein [Deltaproteobacteria bacterium]
MRLLTLLTLVVVVAHGLPARASTPPSGPGLHYPEWLERHGRDADPEPSDFKLISYFFVRGSVTNQLGDPAGLKGVSLGPIGIGENVGSGTKVADGTETIYVEQRWIPVLSYSPAFTDGLATLRAQFEIDFMWGQSANQLQHNQGGGFNADQVNIQTKNINAALYPTRNPYKLAIVLGAQSVYDSVYDPAINSLFDIVKTGYKLTFLGSDATGVAVYSRMYGIWKASFLPLGAAQPDKATENDSRLAFAWLATADYAYSIAPGTVVGVSYWRLQDQTKGAAYAYEGLVKSGPSSTGLPPYTGVAHLNLEQPNGSVNYLGANFHHNINFRQSDFGASGFVMLNFGRFESTKEDTQLLPAVDVLGAAANLELMYNWGLTDNDVITLEGLFTTGDSNLEDDRYTGAFTMNYYGIPGAVWLNHKTLLLFPFTQTVSNYTGAVTDISNQGYGLVTAIASGAWDLIPNKLNLKIGAAYAQSAVTPPPAAFGIARGRTIGLELNAELKYTIRYLMTVGLHVGYLNVGNFFDANPSVTTNPWAAFTTFTWYAF